VVCFFNPEGAELRKLHREDVNTKNKLLLFSPKLIFTNFSFLCVEFFILICCKTLCVAMLLVFGNQCPSVEFRLDHIIKFGRLNFFIPGWWFCFEAITKSEIS